MSSDFFVFPEYHFLSASLACKSFVHIRRVDLLCVPSLPVWVCDCATPRNLVIHELMAATYVERADVDTQLVNYQPCVHAK